MYLGKKYGTVCPGTLVETAELVSCGSEVGAGGGGEGESKERKPKGMRAQGFQWGY